MKPERGFVASAGSQIGSRQAGSKVPTGNSRRTGRRAEERPLKSLASGKTVACERERERARRGANPGTGHGQRRPLAAKRAESQSKAAFG